jgi:hypothetical protein
MLIFSCVGSLAMSITYGLPVQRRHDPFIQLAEDALAGAGAAGAPGRFLVNIIPWLKHVPEWMPGAGFKQVAKEIKKKMDRLEEEPYQATLKMMVCSFIVAYLLVFHGYQREMELHLRLLSQILCRSIPVRPTLIFRPTT